MMFKDKTYEDIFYDIFQKTAETYNLNIIKISDNSMELKGQNYILLIEISMDGSSITYIDSKENIYDITNYIATSMVVEDKNGLFTSNIIADYVRDDLIATKRILDRKYQNLLSGKTDWFDAYKKSQWYMKVDRMPPIIEKEGQ